MYTSVHSNISWKSYSFEHFDLPLDVPLVYMAGIHGLCIPVDSFDVKCESVTCNIIYNFPFMNSLVVVIIFQKYVIVYTIFRYEFTYSGYVLKVPHCCTCNSCNMGTSDLPDMYTQSPRAEGIHIRQITSGHVTTNM